MMFKKNICSNRISFILILCGLTLLVVLSTIFYSSHYNKRNARALSQKIYAVLDHYRIMYDIDAHSIDPNTDTTPQAAKGIEQCIQNIAYFVAKKEPINMLLVGFPFKSGNQKKKVLGPLPDMAERTSLEYTQKMLNEIKAVYSQGAKILIFCDGILFAPIFGIPFTDVVSYENELKLLCADLPDITIFTSQNMMKKHGLKSTTEIVQLIDQYEPSDKQFRTELKEIPEIALKRVAMDLDYTQGRILIEKNSLPEIVMNLLSREMRLRSYISKTFPSPDFFRLTVHFSADVSKKFGIRLSPTSNITPYHGVMVQSGDISSILFKKDVDMNHYIYDEKLINGRQYGYYKQIK